MKIKRRTKNQEKEKFGTPDKKKEFKGKSRRKKVEFHT